jgi:hypothetical protein
MQVRDLVRPSEMKDESWPGSVLPRAAFLPPRSKKEEFNDNKYVDRDIRPFQLTNKQSVIEALKELQLPNPFEEANRLAAGVTVRPTQCHAAPRRILSEFRHLATGALLFRLLPCDTTTAAADGRRGGDRAADGRRGALADEHAVVQGDDVRRAGVHGPARALRHSVLCVEDHLRPQGASWQGLG